MKWQQTDGDVCAVHDQVQNSKLPNSFPWYKSRYDRGSRDSLWLAEAAPCSADASGELDVFLHDGNPFRVYGAEIRVLEEMHQECLSCFL